MLHEEIYDERTTCARQSDHTEESRDICDPTVEGCDMLSVPPSQSTNKGRTESHRSSSHVPCRILFSFSLEMLRFFGGIISDYKILILVCSYPKAKRELQSFPLSHYASQS